MNYQKADGMSYAPQGLLDRRPLFLNVCTDTVYKLFTSGDLPGRKALGNFCRLRPAHRSSAKALGEKGK
jgi:hypothetical protein